MSNSARRATILLPKKRSGQRIKPSTSVAVFVLILTFLSLLGPTPSAEAEATGEEVAEIDLSRLSIGSKGMFVVDIEVESKRAIEGTLVVRNFTADGAEYQYPINLPAQSNSVQTVAVASPFGDVNLSVELVEDDNVVASNQLQPNFASQASVAVAVFGFDDPASEGEFVVDEMPAAFFAIEDLATISTYDTIVGQPSALRELNEDEQDVLTSWISIGGQLIVSGDPGSIDEQLPDSWQSTTEVFLADSGMIRYVGADWEQQITPGLNSTAIEPSFPDVSGEYGNELFQDAQIQLPSLGWLITGLLFYVLLIGPVLYIILRVSKKSILVWLITPVAAIVTTGGVLAIGSTVLSARTSVHTSIIEVTPTGAHATSTILLTESGKQQIDASAGWTIETQNDGRYEDTSDTGSRTVLQPRRDETVATVQVGRGDVGILRMQGPVDDYAGALTIDVDLVTDEEIVGSVTNSSGTKLNNAVIGTSQHAVEVGTLRDGETTKFTLETDRETRAGPAISRELELWSDWDNSINKSRWANLRINREDTLTGQGTIMVAAWTTELSSPLGPDKGRTALVARTALSDSGEPQHGMRSSRVTSPQDQAQATQIRQFVRTPDTPPMAVRSLPENNVEVWVGGAWQPLVTEDAVVSLSEDLWINDTLYIREQFDPDPLFVTELVPDDGSATAPVQDGAANAVNNELDERGYYFWTQPPLTSDASDRFIIQRPDDQTLAVDLNFQNATFEVVVYLVDGDEEVPMPELGGEYSDQFQFEFEAAADEMYIIEVINRSPDEHDYEIEVVSDGA